MNKILIKYTHFSAAAEVLINNEPISPYSEISSLLGKNFFDYAAKLIGSFDKEIYDDYTIELNGNQFQFDILCRLSEDSEYCKNVSLSKINDSFSIRRTRSVLADICRCYGIEETAAAPELYISSSCNAANSLPEFKIKNVPEAAVGLFDEADEIPDTIKYPVILSYKYDVRQTGHKTVFIIPKERISELFEQLEYEFVLLPQISSMLMALKYTNLSDEHKAKLDYYLHGKPSFIISGIKTSLDKGEAVKIDLISFPDDYFTVISSDVSVVNINGNMLNAIGSGTADILVIDKDHREHKRFGISVIEHNYVESIRLIPRFDYLKRNDRNVIDMVASPIGAEDYSQLVWSVSDPGILNIDSNGNVIALNEGKVTVTVKGRKASDSIIVEVKPQLQKIYFPAQSIRLKGGETYIIDCRTVPENAPIDALQWELDNRNIASINPSKNGLRCQVIASSSYEGKGNIKCYDANTRLGAICNLEVVSKIKPNSLGKAALTCLLLGIIIPFLLPVSSITSIAGLIKDEESDHKKRYILCLIFSTIFLIVWLSALGGN